MLFSALAMRYVSEKSTLNRKLAKNQVTKEKHSIQRLDVSGSTGPGGQLPPLPTR